MLKRKMYDYLMDWRESKGRECLLIKGARQVGKTYLVERFAEDNYGHFVEVDFLRRPEASGAFEGSLEVDDILAKLSLYYPEAEFVPGDTLLFLDEIQECPKARTALKPLAIDGRFDVIASGSLLGLHYGQDPELKEEIPSIPVGYEKQITMYSLDFEEFLWAFGVGQDSIDYLRGFFDRQEKVPDGVNEKMQEYLRNYIVIGGMPEAVAAFVAERDYAAVQDAQDKILASIADDISRHSKGAEKVKVRKCWDSIPAQLAKENRKFQYSKVESKGTTRKFGNSIQWLADADLVHRCLNVSTPTFPLRAYEREDYFKLYVSDTGLLVAMFGYEMKRAVLDKALKGPAKGGLYENLVADFLVKAGHALHYYKPDENDQEIEFLLDDSRQPIPVEVKARRGATRSLDGFIDAYGPEVAYKFADGNVGCEGAKVTLPHYMAMFL